MPNDDDNGKGLQMSLLISPQKMSNLNYEYFLKKFEVVLDLFLSHLSLIFNKKEGICPG